MARPYGTCYLATDPMQALVELIGPEIRDGFVSQDFVDGRWLYTGLHMTDEAKLANTTAPSATRFLTGELHSVADYSMTQSWADWFRRSGFSGVRYAGRHDPTLQPHCIALFGRAGERTDWVSSSGGPIPWDLLRRLEKERGVVVLPVPDDLDLHLPGRFRSGWLRALIERCLGRVDRRTRH